MAGREELYLKHIDENTGRIAKALEYIVEREKEIKAEQEQWAKEKKELVEPVKKQDKYDEVAEEIKRIIACVTVTEKDEPNDKSGWDPLWDGR